MSRAPRQPESPELAALRARLADGNSAAGGPRYWRSLDELADTPEFRNWLEREFPEGASELHLPSAGSRRDFLKLMAASLALAGATGCGIAPPAEKIFPYVRAPEEVIPGRPLFYATAHVLAGYASGILVESHTGRPTKIEGNPEHPASLGATDVFAQASILELYDPDRSQTVLHAGRISTWEEFLRAAALEIEAQRATGGAGLRILTGTITSPTLAAQLRDLLAEFPAARWHVWEPAGRDAAREGARLAFGEEVETQLRLEAADVILALDADFLAAGPGAVRYAREFARRRRPDSAAGMNRLYAAEPTPTLTGAMADHRLAISTGGVAAMAQALAARFGIGPREPLPESLRAHEGWLDAVARDLERAAGRSMVVAGDAQPAEVHALAHAINAALGNAGRTVVYTEPVEARPAGDGSLTTLVEQMRAGRVQALVMLGGNPVYDAPADLDFAAALEGVRFRAHLALYEDETSRLSHWHIPQAHALEAWSDARAFDGTATILQPLIAPLYGGKSAHELLAALLARTVRSGYEIVREHWRPRLGADFERAWRRAVHDGVVPATPRAGPRRPALTAAYRPGGRPPAPPAPERAGMEILFRADASVFDGRFANNGWLQELPRPLTKLTWENAALVSPADAARLGLREDDVVELELDGRKVNAPVAILPGQAAGAVTVHLGYGRERAGRVGNRAGFNAYALRRSAALWADGRLAIRKTGRRSAAAGLARTQSHHSMEGRPLAIAASAAEYAADPQIFRRSVGAPPPELTLYPGHKYEGYSWGMAIDLAACIGCNACTIACQAENNIPIVGKREVIRGREMHWIRVDRYFEGAPEAPQVHHQPVPCMHCENAPCEVVCPVAATAHSSEGLNDMVYNRCVGTRYCSNNCPYKVRRFNFFQYSDLREIYPDRDTASLRLGRNPNVTIRTRGVMEKCTYCVQRINAARITAEMERRQIRDGEIATACQAVCPAEAIVFGNLNDPASRVSRLKAEARNYGLLESINTRPRTTYLGRLRNPNPELEAG
jgi:molybdopterin-containing oxidoreductase family iron-sulfur binding subunit